MATVVYDATKSFCDRFVDRHSRTHDQMVQAARSGRQNIAEGSRASATSSQTELRLLGVARASLDELLLDYEDFLRQRRRPQWARDDPEAREVRAVGSQTHPANPSDRSNPYARWIDAADPALVANAVICLIHQTNYLLDRQISALERDFINEGGYSERLAAARLARREASDPSNPSDPSDPTAPCCPQCSKPMTLRTARKGTRVGAQFWGCSGYPDCRATRPV